MLVEMEKFLVVGTDFFTRPSSWNLRSVPVLALRAVTEHWNATILVL